MSSPSEEPESELKNTNTSSHQIPPVVDDARSEEIIGKSKLLLQTARQLCSPTLHLSISSL